MTLEQAMDYCLVRGYIARTSKPLIKLWKNSWDFRDKIPKLSDEDKEAVDWHTYDPEGEETSIVG